MQNTLLFTLFCCLLGGSLPAQSVTPWLTRGDKSLLLSKRPDVNFNNNTSSTSNTITLQSTKSQSVVGFGFTLTQGSAQVISGLSAVRQNQLLQELFGNNGLRISALRISIGASDLSNSVYSYNETNGDVNMNNFSLNGPDKTYLIPILKKIRAINPGIRILATPWTAPTWMKTNNSWVGGSLRTNHYSAYARYFVKYLEAMDNEGIPIWAITPQNEPENGNNQPSMLMTSAQQKTFINDHLGPQIANSSYNPIIIAFDHNCDNTAYPIDVLNNSSYVDGAAFHLYAGNISAMSTVRNATGKNVYFTEQYTDSNGNFNGDFSWHMRNVVIGSLSNFSRTVFEWNLAANSSDGPRTSGGCMDCLPAITIPNSNSYSRNVSYYIIGQVSKFIRRGARRINSSNNNNQLYSVAFENTNGERVVVAYNDASGNKTVRVRDGGKAFNYTISGKSAVTLVWTPGDNLEGDFNIISRRSGKGLDVANNATGNNSNVQQYQIANGGGDNQRWRFVDAGNGYYSIRARHSNKCLSQRNNTASNVVQQNCWNTDRQKWKLINLSNGYYALENKQTRRRLHVANNSTSNGANIQVWNTNNNTNQEWRFDPVSGSNFAVGVLGEIDEGILTEELEQIREVGVFPNPATQRASVTLPDLHDFNSAMLFDAAGRKILEISLNPDMAELPLLLEEYSAGVYTLRLNSPTRTVTKKLIKN